MPTINETRSKLQQFRRLPTGWYYGEGTAIDEKQVELAERILARAEELGIRRADAFPGPNDQIGLSFYIGDDTLALTIDEADDIQAQLEIGDEEISSYNISESSALLFLWHFARMNPDTYALSTQNTGKVKKVDFGTWLSRNPRKSMGAEYQSSTLNVYEIKSFPYAATSASGTVRV